MNPADGAGALVVLCCCPQARARAVAAAGALGAPLLVGLAPNELNEPAYALVFDEQGLALHHTGRKVPGPVRVDFTAGALAHRRHFGGGKGQMIARAVGVRPHVYPRVLDATAGLGRDAFVLACLGCRVDLYERSPLAWRLLEEGLEQGRAAAEASDDRPLADILARMRLHSGEAVERLEALAGADEDRPDVVYLDPMFPARRKSADVKKEMQVFHALVGADEDADRLLEPALAAARYRVVVKRPRKAPDLAGRAPGHRLEGKSSRFDVYPLRRLPERLNEPN